MTILCLASYEKGHAFLQECKRQGCRVILITSESLKETAKFPVDAIDELFYMPDVEHKWDVQGAIHAVSYLARTRQIDRIVPLDDFDLELAATLREHLRLPGMGESATRYFRDKLAMRMQAAAVGVPVPEFSAVFNHDRLREFLARVPGPWLLKPRLMAGAIGIKKLEKAEEIWPLLEKLGDQQSYFLVERFVPGDIFHVDSIVYGGEVRFALASRYGAPPLEVSHGGGIFTTQVMDRQEEFTRELLALNATTLKGMGLRQGVSHTEFLRDRADGRLYFLETSARVGGANIADLVDAASGLNLWAEWAKTEIAGGESDYRPAPSREEYAGLIVSLARQERPDTSQFNDPEIIWRLDKKNHVGMIVHSTDRQRVQQLLDSYVPRIQQNFHASAPPQERPTH